MATHIALQTASQAPHIRRFANSIAGATRQEIHMREEIHA
jgi:hypothetical protein